MAAGEFIVVMMMIGVVVTGQFRVTTGRATPVAQFEKLRATFIILMTKGS